MIPEDEILFCFGHVTAIISVSSETLRLSPPLNDFEKTRGGHYRSILQSLGMLEHRVEFQLRARFISQTKHVKRSHSRAGSEKISVRLRENLSVPTKSRTWRALQSRVLQLNPPRCATSLRADSLKVF